MATKIFQRAFGLKKLPGASLAGCLHEYSSSCIVAETKHLTSANPWPHLEPNTLRLYSMKWCPFAHRTRLAICYKNLQHEVVNVNLKNKPSWLLKRNPEGTVPVLEIIRVDATQPKKQPKSQLILGSLECAEWLERCYPNTPRLFEKNDQSRILTLLNIFKQMTGEILDYIRHYDSEDKSEVETILLNKLKYLEDKMDEDSRFVAGSAVTMTDFLLWPTFERLLAAGLELQDLPILKSWCESMSKLPAVTQTRNTTAGYHKYWALQKAGKTVYDLD